MAPATPRSTAGRKRVKMATGGATALPPDMLFVVFLNLPAAPACRFRAVCSSWRDLLSGRAFLAAHEARRGPLLLAAGPYRNHLLSWHVDLVDLAGAIAKRTRVTEGRGVRELLPCGDLACIVGFDGRARVLDPSAGAVTAVPHGLSEENEAAAGWARGETFQAVAYAFGRVASTGEHKLLRLVRLLRYTPNRRAGQLVEVLTVGGIDATWRSRQRPPFLVAGDGADSIAVVNGVVYFLAVGVEQLPFAVNGVVIAEPGSIAAFNLDTEEWMPVLRGSLRIHRQGSTMPLESPLLTLAELNGFLVTVHSDRCQQPSMDLWFLVESKPETWVKNYSIQLDLCPRRRESSAHPLFVDGSKILLWVRPKGALMVYDLQTGSCKDLDHTINCVAVGLYKGSMLSSISV
ncbi:unnamed protein product [Urochloa humidicola]